MNRLEAIARNPKTPPDTLAALAADASEYVRRYVARNPQTPPDTLAKLAEDASEYVRIRALVIACRS